MSDKHIKTATNDKMKKSSHCVLAALFKVFIFPSKNIKTTTNFQTKILQTNISNNGALVILFTEVCFPNQKGRKDKI